MDPQMRSLAVVLVLTLWGAMPAGPSGLSAALPPLEATSSAGTQSRPPDQILSGERAHSEFGWSVAGVGDVNGDGYDDVVIGAPRYNPGLGDRGKIYLYYGGPNGLDTTPAFTTIGGGYSQFGYAVAGAGDVNGDGYSDVVVGAPYTYNGPDPVGRMVLYTGGPEGLSFAFAHSDFAAASSCLGWAVAGPGDLDRDGYDDVVAGDICHITSTGRVLVYHGSSAGLSSPPTTILPGHQEYAFFGYATAGAGDVNGDGYPDVVIGEHGYELSGSTREGRAYIYHGGPGGLSAPEDTTFTGQGSDSLGCAVAGGDLNGDAYSDVLIGGNYSFSSWGRVYGYQGSSSGVQSSPIFSVTRNSGHFGTAVALPGDLGGDGYSDAVVGAYSEDGESGAVLLYAGSAGGLSATPALILTDERPHDRFGYAVAAAGDVNGDGHPDLLVGAPHYSEDEQDAIGRVYLYFGGALAGLVLRKSVEPVYAQPGMPLTYTITLRNSEAEAAPGLALTDTLPASISFTQWGERPAGTVITDGRLTWQGTLAANTTLTFSFGVTHALEYGQAATNVASYTQGTRQGSSAATFYVWRQVYLPMVVRQ
jgi:uncharacterized repeat protein (TIGR01451 family)